MLCEFLRGYVMSIALVVLILVLMEDALRAYYNVGSITYDVVLILVLMEDALRVEELCLTRLTIVSLNPCSNGRCSARHLLQE